MKQILLLFVASLFISHLHAQESKQKMITAYAITAPQKGQNGWTEVRLIDIITGEEVQTIYQSSQTPQILNARTGKPVVKKEVAESQLSQVAQDGQRSADRQVRVFYAPGQQDGNKKTRAIHVKKSPVDSYQPFSTYSAACAYDKKHNRLYYTPMGINQLRYIDLKTNQIYYFEDEAFGLVKNRGDVANQITRMVFAADGNGYALSNDARHLIRFTTGKKPTITDLGSLNDDPANKMSVHHSGGYGGDLIADAQKNLYLITASRQVFRINLETKMATHLGAITGLPRGFSTNGAFVEEGSKVIVCSSNSTQGYYRFDLNTLQAELVSGQGTVFNASDLASGTLAFEKKKKEKKQRKERKPAVTPVVEEEKPVVSEVLTKESRKPQEQLVRNSISVYPNPVTNGIVRISFADQPEGKYQVQFMDISGKTVSVQEVNIHNKMQVESFRLPGKLAKGNYLVKVSHEASGSSITKNLVVQ